MLAPISWLKDFVDITVSPETLAKKLVSIGFEVEEIIYQKDKVKKVVTGKITEVEKHPNADRLRITKIDVGSQTLQVVTNVPVIGGETVALALDGAELANGVRITRGELRGVLSEGMLCGPEELGLSADEIEGQDPDDIIRYSDSVPAGLNALEALGLDDVVLDVSVTANRPDCNSIYKLAKEVAVALGVSCREPQIRYEVGKGRVWDMVSVDVQNKELCPRYMAAGITSVKIFPSCEKIKKRLRAVGIRPINNIVDITNYVLTEIGQPMHAFDKRNLNGSRIIVRNAREGEKIVTLDGKQNELTQSMLVIADAENPIAVAGVMGGEFSGIKNDTAQIVFESAKFARDNVRRTSRALNLRSDSSARFEKGIDFASQELGLKRALTLIYESGSGEIAEGIIDESVEFERSRDIEFDLKKIKEILGCNVPKNTFKGILERLGLKISENGKRLIARVPEDREDIVGVNDLAEEFIRVYGYSHIKPTLFEYASLTKGGKPDKMLFVDRVKSVLASFGSNECVTYSFTSPKFADMLSLPEDSPLRQTVKLINPLGEALSVMRTTLTHSMLEVLSQNIAHFNREASLFEVAKVYLPKSLPLEDLPYEEEKLVIGMYGANSDFFGLKAAVDTLLNSLNTDGEYKKAEYPFLHPGRSAEVYVNGEIVGYLGEVHPDTAARYDVDCRLYVAELSLDKLYEKRGGLKTFKPYSKFPTIERDLAVVVDENIPAAELVGIVKNAKIKHLENVAVFDTYKSAQIGEGKKSVALNFSFSSLQRTLTDDEVAAETAKILNALKRKAGAKLR